jgi:hypothetical protein
MQIERIRQQLAGFGLPSRLIDGLGIAGPEEQMIGLATGFGVAAEEGPDFALESDRHGIAVTSKAHIAAFYPNR